MPELILEQGRMNADAIRRSGDIWAQTIAQAAGGIGEAIQRAPHEKEALEVSKSRRAALEEETAGRQQARGIATRRQAAVAAGGTREEILARLGADPLGYSEAIKHFREIDDNLKRTLGSYAAAVRAAGDSPEYARAALADMVENGFDAKKLEPYAGQMLTKGGVTRIIDTLLKGSPDEGHRNLATKQQAGAPHVVQGALVDPTGKVLYQAPPKADTPTAGSFEDYMLASPERRAEIERARKGYGQADDKPAVLAYQSKEVLDDEGRPVMANFDARSGAYVNASTGRPIKNPRPVPSAAETQDARKFAQAGPVLSAVSELSEKINTQQGLIAKMAGGASKIAAKANYDDDVAEYEALVMGFTPLVARALGHTGVLTEQDVRSVRMLFPKPGDSKTLRDRKVARINSIVGQLEGAAAGGLPGAAPGPRVQTNPLAVTAPNGKTYYFKTKAEAEFFKNRVGLK